MINIKQAINLMTIDVPIYIISSNKLTIENSKYITEIVVTRENYYAKFDSKFVNLDNIYLSRKKALDILNSMMKKEEEKVNGSNKQRY